MKYIEYVARLNQEFSVLLIDIEDISIFKQIPKEDMVTLITKNNQTFEIVGTYKTITNRYFYTISKKVNIIDDDIIRPSIRVFHKKELLEPDVSFLDEKQLNAFIKALN